MDLAVPATQICFDGVGTPGKSRKQNFASESCKQILAATSPLRSGDVQNKQNK
jgi:hypothetical protein